MSSHSPGPWRINRHGYESMYATHAFFEDADGSLVAGIWWPDGRPEQEANARLIAAAPLLLAELKRWHSCATVRDDGTCNGCSASEAIAVAEGRP